MELSFVPSVSGNANAFTVKLAKGQSNQQEAVVGKILEGVSEAPSPSSREGFQTGKILNVAA